MDDKTHALFGQVIAILKGLADMIPHAHSIAQLLAALEQNHAALADAGATAAGTGAPTYDDGSNSMPSVPPEAPAPNPDEQPVTA